MEDDKVLYNMTKDNLIKHIKKLEEIIEKYDQLLMRQYSEKEVALSYVNSLSFKKDPNRKITLTKILKGTEEIYLKTPENYDYIMTLIENNKKLGKELEIRDRKMHHALGYMENAYPEPDWHYVYEILDERNVKDGITRTCTRK